MSWKTISSSNHHWGTDSLRERAPPVYSHSGHFNQKNKREIRMITHIILMKTNTENNYFLYISICWAINWSRKVDWRLKKMIFSKHFSRTFSSATRRQTCSPRFTSFKHFSESFSFERNATTQRYRLARVISDESWTARLDGRVIGTGFLARPGKDRATN